MPEHPPTSPLVVASVNNDHDLRSLHGIDLPQCCDLLEIRLDGLALNAPPLEKCPRPLLLTPRCREEGGWRDWSIQERITAVNHWRRPGCWIDLEASTLDASTEALSAARAWVADGHPLVCSFHDFSGMPTDSQLDHYREVAMTAGASVFKVAATANDFDSFLRLANWFHRTPWQPKLSAMPMGRFGLSGRLLLATAGSFLNYGFLREASVPGQWRAAEMRALLQDSRA